MPVFQEVKKCGVGADAFIRAFAKLSLLSLFFFLLSLTGIANAATYYASPSGSGTTCSSSSPCSLTTGLERVAAGDTLFLKDGVYNQSLKIAKSGSSGSYITIKAQNDGQATVITNSSAPACFINSKSYVDLEGIVCVGQGSTYYRAVDVDSSSHINLRRISAYNKSGEDGSGFNIDGSSYVLIEDGVAFGNDRKQYNIQSDDHVTLRRCWASFDNWLGTGSQGDLGTLTIYGSSNCIVENCIVTRTPSSIGTIHGIHNWANTGQTADNNAYYGNVVYGLTDWSYLVNRADASVGSGNNIFTNNVGINNLRGFYQRADTNMTVTNLTMAGTTSATVGAYEVDASGTVTGVAGNVTNASLYGSAGYGFYRADSTLNHRYNNLYSNVNGDYRGTTTGPGELKANPYYDTITYGKGAYLMVPPALQRRGEGGADIGAKVLYRYQDGVLTDVPLWPWPMENRIKAETGYSVTWESGGGLWKTLEGVYTESDTTPPSSPSGLVAVAVSSSQINLAWAASTDNIGVIGYQIYKGSALIATIQSSSYSDTGLAPSTTYTYAVTAFDAAGNVSPLSTSSSATTLAAADTMAPSTPTGLTATAASCSQINLSWAASTDNIGVTGYKVYKKGSLIATTTSKTSYSDEGLTASMTYTYAVSAFDAAGNVSAISPAASATTQTVYANTTTSTEVTVDNSQTGTSHDGSWYTSLGTNPYGVDSLYGSDGSTYTWRATLPQTGSYDVYVWWTIYPNRTESAPLTVTYNGGTKTVYVNQQQNGGQWNYIGTFSFDCATGGIVVLTAVDPYPTTYSADAVKFVYNSSMPAGDSQAPSVPTNLTAKAVSSAQIALSWTASADNVGVAGYRIYRNGALIATTQSTSFSNTGLSASTSYGYAVAAYDAAGNLSPMSAAVSATTAGGKWGWGQLKLTLGRKK
jgi:chitodextrinase